MSRLVRNISYNVVGQLTLVVLGLVSARYVSSRLGRDVLGIIYFSLMLNVIVVAVLELGITTTTVKEVSAHRTEDPDYVRRLVRSGAFFYWIGYAVAASSLLVAAPWLVRSWIDLQTISPETATTVLRVLGATTLLALPQAFYVSVIRGVQRMGIPNSVDVGIMVLQQGGIIAIISWSGDVLWVACWIAATYVLRVAVLAVVIAHLFDRGALVPKLDVEIVRRNRSFAAQMIAASGLAMVHMQADKVVISKILPVSSIGVYGVLYGMIGRVSALTSAVAQGAFPTLSQLARSGQRQQLVETYQRLQDLLCHGLVPLYALLAFLALPIFAAIFGADTATSLVLPAGLLALGFYLNNTLTIPYMMCLATGRPGIVARQNFVALFATLPVTLVLTWQLEFTGAAVAWVWYQLFCYLNMIPRVCRECIGIPPSQWFRHIAATLVRIAGSFGIAAAIVGIVAPRSTAALAIGYGAGFVVYVVSTWTTMSAESRAVVQAGIAKALGRATR